jgi:hypothetical protein
MSPLLKKDDRLGEAENLQRWAVVRKIGDGGFAEVYEVRDTLNDDAQVRVPAAWPLATVLLFHTWQVAPPLRPPERVRLLCSTRSRSTSLTEGGTPEAAP